MGIRRMVSWAVVLASAAAWPSATWARQVSFSVSSGATTSSYLYDLETRATRPATPAQAEIGAVFTADGQFAARSAGTSILELRHMPSGRVSSFAVDFRPFVAHPRRLTLFGYTGIGELARFDERGLVQWSPCGPAPIGLRVLPSTDGGRVFVTCPTGGLVTLDADTGRELTRAAVAGAARVTALAAGPGGAQVVVSRTLPGGSSDIATVDVATGSVLATRATPFSAGLVSMPTGRQVIEVLCSGNVVAACTFALVDAATLTTVRALSGASMFHCLFVTPDERDVIVSDDGSVYFDSRIARIDTATGAIVDSASVPFGTTLRANLLPLPVAPTIASSTVTGRTVILTWQLSQSSMVTGYRLSAGTRAGASDVATLALGPTSTFTAGNVPPGRYYVRLQAVNYTGAGRASNDVVIDVP